MQSKIVNSLPIYHVYGKVGSLLWQSGKKRDYGNSFSHSIKKGEIDEIKRLARNIKIMDERQKRSDINEIHRSIHESKKIIGMGFGFNDINLQRIFQPADYRNKKLHFTAPGIGDADRIRVIKYFEKITKRYYDEHQPNHRIPDSVFTNTSGNYLTLYHNMKCLDLIQNISLD